MICVCVELIYRCIHITACFAVTSAPGSFQRVPEKIWANLKFLSGKKFEIDPDIFRIILLLVGACASVSIT